MGKVPMGFQEYWTVTVSEVGVECGKWENLKLLVTMIWRESPRVWVSENSRLFLDDSCKKGIGEK